MSTATIASLLALKPGTIVPDVRGVIEAVSEFYQGKQQNPDGSERAWSLQTVIVKDKTGKIAVEIGRSWPATEQSKGGRVPLSAVGSGIVFLAHQKARGGLSGLKVEQQDGQAIVRCSNTGEFTFIQAPIEAPEQLPGAEVGDEEEDSGDGAGESRPGAGNVVGPPPTAIPSQEVQQTVSPSSAGPVPNPSPWSNIGKGVSAWANVYELCARRVINGVVPHLAEHGLTIGSAQIQDATRCIFEATATQLRESGERIPDAPLPERKIAPPAK